RRACAVSAFCQIKRARPVLISRGAIAGIHAAWLTSSARSQKKKRLRSWAVSTRIQRARGCRLNKYSETCDMVAFAHPDVKRTGPNRAWHSQFYDGRGQNPPPHRNERGQSSFSGGRGCIRGNARPFATFINPG